MGVALGDIIRVRIGSFTPTQAAINTVHYRVTAVTGGGAELSSIANQIDTTMAPLYRAYMSVGATYRGVRGCLWATKGVGALLAIPFPVKSLVSCPSAPFSLAARSVGGCTCLSPPRRTTRCPACHPMPASVVQTPSPWPCSPRSFPAAGRIPQP
jgi:hypothetical protein